MKKYLIYYIAVLNILVSCNLFSSKIKTFNFIEASYRTNVNYSNALKVLKNFPGNYNPGNSFTNLETLYWGFISYNKYFCSSNNDKKYQRKKMDLIISILGNLEKYTDSHFPEIIGILHSTSFNMGLSTIGTELVLKKEDDIYWTDQFLYFKALLQTNKIFKYCPPTIYPIKKYLFNIPMGNNHNYTDYALGATNIKLLIKKRKHELREVMTNFKNNEKWIFAATNSWTNWIKNWVKETNNLYHQ